MEIRAAKPDDAENISKLICELVDKFITDDFSPSGREFLLSTMTPGTISWNMQTEYRYHVAEADGAMVGVVAVKGNTHLYHLFVAERYHRKGIARKLWQRAMKECLLEGNPGEFTVNSSSYAREVYKQLGFVAQSGPQEKHDVRFFPMKLIIKKPVACDDW